MIETLSTEPLTKIKYLKLLQELGELSDNVCKGNDIRDDIGDMLSCND